VSKISETTGARIGGVPEDLAVCSVPLRRRFRGVDVREVVLVRGRAGWGEFSPFREYGDREALPWWRAAREAADTGWPRPVRSVVPVNATVPAVPAAQVEGVLARFPGCTTVKVKVAEPGRPMGEDLERLAAVRDVVGAVGRVRIDANGAWDVDDAVARIRWYDRAAGGLEYVEQPCSSVEELATVRRRVDVPIAADESVRWAEDPVRVARLGAADLVVLKVQPLGGVRACLRLAEQVGLPVVVSSALETSVGIAAGLALAAALPELPYACGLGTVGLLERDVVAHPLLPVDGVLHVRRPEPDCGLVRESAASDAARRWWHERITRVEALR
jgi:O-succinylbenzoate synthase